MVPDRRTIIVLASLVVGMTLTSGVLLVLEPGPVAPVAGVTLQSIDRQAQGSPADRLFDIPEPRDWEGIVIHDAGAERGSAATIARQHRELGKDGLGYHFVVNNGSLKADGLIEIGYRWRRQEAGAYLAGDGSKRFNERFIGISLIGDGDARSFTKDQMRELVWLVNELQQRFNLPRRKVFVDVSRDSAPAGTFPHAWFRKQLLRPTRTASAR